MLLTSYKEVHFTKNKFQPHERIVTVILNAMNTGKKKNFRCNECGSILFQYYTSMEVFFEGEILEYDQNPIEIMCVKGGCKRIYKVVRL